MLLLVLLFGAFISIFATIQYENSAIRYMYRCIDNGG